MKKDFIYYLPSVIVSALIGFLSIKLFSTHFSTHDYGDYAIVTSIIGLSSCVSNGINSFYFRFYNELKEKRETFFNTVLSLRFGIIIITFIVAFVYIIFSRETTDILFLKLITLGLISQSIGYILGFFQSIHRIERKIKKYTLYTIINQILGFVIAVMFIYFFNKDIYFIFIGTIISSSVVLFFVFKDLQNKLPRYKICFDNTIMKKYYTFGIPMTYAIFASAILSFSDRLIIDYYLTSTEVALYNIPARITEKSILLLLVLFETVDRPYILGRLSVTSRDDIEKDILSFVHMFLIVMVPVITIYFVLSKELIFLISDSKYIEADQIIPIIALSYFFIGIGSRYQVASLVAEKTSVFVKISITSGILNIIGNIVLIPMYGYTVAAWTTLFSAFVYFLLHIYVSKKYFLTNIMLLKLLKFIIIGIVLILTVQYIYLNTIMHFSLSHTAVLFLFLMIILIIYILLLFVFREHKSIVTIFRKVIKR